MYMDFILLDGAHIKVFDVYGFYSFRWGANKSFGCIWVAPEFLAPVGKMTECYQRK